jgi:hypothetical protein
MTNDKVSIRPIIANISSIENKSKEEQFQNVVLRPIIKMQHNLLVLFFEHHTLKKKVLFAELSDVKKEALIAEIFKNDSQFKIELRGLIIGHFTVEEFTIYQNMPSEINKRIYTMIKERLLSTI